MLPRYWKLKSCVMHKIESRSFDEFYKLQKEIFSLGNDKIEWSKTL